MELLPVGKYTFELLPGARYDERNGGIVAMAAVVNNGEFNGKRVYLTYPDPESIGSRSGKVQSWSTVAFKRFEQAIGIEIDAGEDKVDYLHRIAGNRFTMPVKHSEPSDDYPTAKVNAQLLNVSAAA